MPLGLGVWDYGESVWRFLFEVRCANINIQGVLAGLGDYIVSLSR